MSTGSFIIRRAAEADLSTLGRLGGLLLRTHFDFDRQRFMAPVGNPEAGYARFLGSMLEEDDVAVFVAELEGVVVGYVMAGLEPRSWKELREECGFIHDVIVEATGRRTGLATALIEAAVAWLREKGAPRVMLWTAQENGGAQRLFERLGFRRTMIEMTRELK